jgi:type IV secretion system protein VirB3
MADADELVREPVFTALTRPQMFAGVALALHGLGTIACLGEPRIFDLWILRAQRCPRLPDFTRWQCNSYTP